MSSFQLINQQIFSSWRKIITIRILWGTLRKHTKTDRWKVKSINYQAKKIVQKLLLDDEAEKMLENEAFITIKDQIKGFPHQVSCRLLKPSKTNIGKISKVLLDKINSAILSNTRINQSKNILRYYMV